jgi:hypothetical protein
MSGRVLLILAGLNACAYHPDDFTRPKESRSQVVMGATPPAPPIPEGEVLYQMLYADEFGEEARDLGQRARILGWLHVAGLEQAQLEALIVLSKDVQQSVNDDEDARLVLGAREHEMYAPVYKEIIEGLAGKVSLSAVDLQRHSDALRVARGVVWGDKDPHRGRYERTRQVLKKVETWVDTLDPKQRNNLGKVRFFLRRSMGPLARPAYYEAMIAGTWDMGDFDTLRYAGRSGSEPALDIGGLWRAEAFRTRQNSPITSLQLQALMAAAVLEPGFISALEVSLGRREPLSFSR